MQRFVATVDQFDAWLNQQSEAIRSSWPGAAEELDVDGNGRLQPWELAGEQVRRSLAQRGDDQSPDEPESTGKQALPWIESTLDRRRTPVLLVFGELDQRQAWQYPSFAKSAGRKQGEHVTSIVWPQVGHALGPQEEDRLGPIDSRLVEAMGAWMDEVRDPAIGDK